MKTFDSIAGDLVALHDAKNHDYGDAFAESFKEFGLVTGVIRLNDKVNRLKTLVKNEAMVAESIEDTLKDIACYAIMTLEALDIEANTPKVLTEEEAEKIFESYCDIKYNSFKLSHLSDGTYLIEVGVDSQDKFDKFIQLKNTHAQFADHGYKGVYMTARLIPMFRI